MKQSSIAIALFLILTTTLQPVWSKACGMKYSYRGGAAVFQIAGDCETYTASYIADPNKTVSIFPRLGDIGSNRCSVYEGLNTSGMLLGIYTDHGFNEGMLKTASSNEILMLCSLVKPHNTMVFFVQPYVDTCRDVYLAAVNLPASFVIPSNDGQYLSNLACEMVISSERTCTFTLLLGEDTDISSTDGLYVTSDDSNQLPKRFVSSEGSIVGGRNVSFTGKLLKVDFATGGGEQRRVPKIRVTAECEESRARVACGDRITINVTDLGIVHAEKGDLLYISNTATHDMTSIGENCKARVGDFALFNFDITECQSVSRETEHRLVYTYTVLNTKSGYGKYLIYRQAVSYYFDFTCSYPKSRILHSAPERLIPIISKQQLAPEIELGNLTIAFNLYESAEMTSSLAYNSIINVPDYVYGKVELTGIPQTEGRFIMKMEDCWITMDRSPNAARRYNVIKDGCKVGHVYDPNQAINVTRNHEARYGTFNFQSFVWTNVSDLDQVIYAHCFVKVCDNKAAFCFKPSCTNSRKRRDIERSVGRDETVSVGPLILSKAWRQNCLKCSDLCRAHQGEVVCSCRSGRVLLENGQDCQDEAKFSPSLPNFSYHIIYILVGVIALLAVVVILLVLRWRCTAK